MTGCRNSDFNALSGSLYIRSDAPFRQYSTLSKLQNDRNTYTLYLYGKTDHPQEFVVNKERLYILHSFGDSEGDMRFFYPSRKTLSEIKNSAPHKALDKGDPCLGIGWLKKDVPMQTTKKEDPEIYQWETQYQANVLNTVGSFCDQ